MSDKKLMLGHKVRRLRRDESLTQAQMAADLGISPAYLNLIEHNQRPVTAQVLVKLAGTYQIDLAQFAKDDESELIQTYREVFSNPAFGDLRLSNQDYRDLAALSPEVATAIQTVSDRLNQLNDQLIQVQESGRGEGLDDRQGVVVGIEVANDPNAEVRDFFNANSNHFPALEEIAQALRQRCERVSSSLETGSLETGLATIFTDDTGCSVDRMPVAALGTLLRRLDLHKKRLMVNEAMPASGRLFQVVVQYCFMVQRKAMDAIIARHDGLSPTAKELARQGLANYVAGAFLMPYGVIRHAAEQHKYDIDLLCHVFGASREQICHRLTTLQQSGNRGIPFFLIRLDKAGNVSKRFSGGVFPFSRQGGTCPRWHLHNGLSPSESIVSDVVELPDSARFLSLAVPCKKPTFGYHDAGQAYVIGLGCHIEHADKLIYSEGIDFDSTQPTPIGVNCQLCERLGCAHRAFPPFNHQVVVDEGRRDLTQFSFRSR